jgi:hypothetical protein
VGYLVVSTDRGLCGGLNINLFKKLLADMKAWSDKGVPIPVTWATILPPTELKKDTPLEPIIARSH